MTMTPLDYANAYEMAEALANNTNKESSKQRKVKNKKTKKTKQASSLRDMLGTKTTLAEDDETTSVLSSESSRWSIASKEFLVRSPRAESAAGMQSPRLQTRHSISSGPAQARSSMRPEDPLLAISQKGKHLLDQILETIQVHEQHKDHLRVTMAHHMERGLARRSSDNETGALLSMKKVQQLQAQHDRVGAQLEFFQQQVLAIEAWTTKVQTTLQTLPMSKQDLFCATRASLAMELEKLEGIVATAAVEKGSLSVSDARLLTESAAVEKF